MSFETKVYLKEHDHTNLLIEYLGETKKASHENSCEAYAEEEGFEPPVPMKVRRFSRPVH